MTSKTEKARDEWVAEAERLRKERDAALAESALILQTVKEFEVGVNRPSILSMWVDGKVTHLPPDKIEGIVRAISSRLDEFKDPLRIVRRARLCDEFEARVGELEAELAGTSHRTKALLGRDERLETLNRDMLAALRWVNETLLVRKVYPTNYIEMIDRIRELVGQE